MLLKLITGFLLLVSNAMAMETGRIGNARDTHNCLISAGYQWCEQSQTCIRPWITECSQSKCPDVMCAMYCKDGFMKDDNGCNICKCKVDDKCNDWYYKTCDNNNQCKDGYHCILQKRTCMGSICNCKGMCTRDCSPHKGLCEIKSH